MEIDSGGDRMSYAIFRSLEHELANAPTPGAKTDNHR